jgi:hypothetical protein
VPAVPWLYAQARHTAIKGTGKALEIAFVSSDRDEVAFDSYFKEMSWLAHRRRCRPPVCSS